MSSKPRRQSAKVSHRDSHITGLRSVTINGQPISPRTDSTTVVDQGDATATHIRTISTGNYAITNEIGCTVSLTQYEIYRPVSGGQLHVKIDEIPTNPTGGSYSFIITFPEIGGTWSSTTDSVMATLRTGDSSTFCKAVFAVVAGKPGVQIDVSNTSSNVVAYLTFYKTDA